MATAGAWLRILVAWGLSGVVLHEVAFAENPPPIAKRVFDNELRKHGNVERATRVAFDYWVIEVAEGRWPPGPALNQEIRKWKGPNANQFDLRTGVLVAPGDVGAEQPIPQPQAPPERPRPKPQAKPREAAKKTFGELPLDEKKMLAEKFRDLALPVAKTPGEKASAADSFLQHVLTHPEADWAKASLDHLTSVVLAAEEQNAVAAINKTPIDYLVFYKELLEETRGGAMEYPPGSGTSVSEGLTRRIGAACGGDKPRGRLPDAPMANTPQSERGLEAPAITEPEVPPYVPTKGLLAWWPLDGSARDASKFAHKGIVHGARPAQDRLGRPGHAMTFDGRSDFIEVSDDGTLALRDSFTVAVWFSTSNAQQQLQCLLGKGAEGWGGTSKSTSLNMLINSPYHPPICVGVMDGGRDFPAKINSGVAGEWSRLPSEWVHAACTYGGSRMTLYVNGKKVDQKPLAFCLHNEGVPIYLGQEAEGLQRFFCGSLDDAGVWSRPLTEQEVERLYRADD